MCKVFEDNSGAIELAKVDKVRPRTKHINVRYHHFRHLVDSGQLNIEYIPSEENPADILTHPVSLERLEKHVSTLLKWHLLPPVGSTIPSSFKRGVT